MANARLKLARVQNRKRRRSDAESIDLALSEVPAQLARENAQNSAQDEPESSAHPARDGLEAALVARKSAIEARLSELSLGKPLARLEERGYDANGVRLQRTQRDFLLQEMEWMAADFAQERKWRLKTSRTLSLSVQSHHSKKASRTARQEKMEEEARRRVAARVGREVKKFWTKIDKIITFKVKLQSDELRKAAMDRHLKSLVSQTERYASALAVAFCEPAEGEQHEEVQLEEKAASPSDATAGEDAVTQEHIGHESDSDFEQVDDEDDDETTIEAEEKLHETSQTEQDDELAALQLEGEMSLEELRAKYELMEGVDELHDDDDESMEGAASDDSDFKLDNENADMDDEATIEEEEKTASLYEVEDEVARLQEESEMSIEELRARYIAAHDSDLGREPEDEDVVMPDAVSNGRSGEDDEDDYHPSDGEELDDETTLEVAERDEFTQDEVDEEVALLHQESELSIEELRAKYADVQSEDEAGPSTDASVHDGGDYDESDFQQSGTDEEDDETTIAEAEHAEGRTKNDVDEELAELEEEGNMSVDELRARYYGTAQGESEEDTDRGSDIVDTTDKEEHVDGGEIESRAEGVHEGDGSEYGYDVSSYKRPYLLTSRLELREYQQAGVNWLTSMCEKRINGILADEMGLGKTIQTITMLAHLACARGIWGPHLIVVPTSCMVNWEMEFKRWCPAFKVLTYYGSAKRRKELRHGWSKQNAFQVCITSYQLVVQDAHCFKRKKWYYLILDEAHNIKNWKSLRWQTLLHFNSQRRLLLTGTPLQNNIMELWSLMHFLMPHVFASRKEFTYWFQNPLSVMVEESTGKSTDPSAGTADVMAAEQQQLVSQLHGIIRPFVLRRLKKDVAKQLPGKFEHVITCTLSKRQRFLYEDFISRSSTRRALFGTGKRGGGAGNFMSMMNVLMQLRKVCNHPDLFEPRPIESPLDMEPLTLSVPARCGYIFDWLEPQQLSWWPTLQNLPNQELAGAEKFTAKRTRQLLHFYDDVSLSESLPTECSLSSNQLSTSRPDVLKRLLALAEARRSNWMQKRRQQSDASRVNAHIHEPMLGADMIRACTMPVFISHAMETHEKRVKKDILTRSEVLCDMVQDPEGRIDSMSAVIRKAVCVVPKARAHPLLVEYCGKAFSADRSDAGKLSRKARLTKYIDTQLKPVATRLVGAYYDSFKRTQLFFPDKRLIQFDCGKLQQLDLLLRELKRGNHRCLIFTQMSSMLNILEIFLNLHGYTYFRLDGSTKVETRQYLMEKFNQDDKIFCFILSTRSGGLGINLTGADSVVFYDSDWNPAMDAQAQDRAHRIGQTRDVHIYRLVSEHTVEENILKKAQQKRHLDFLVMAKGEFTTEFFSKASLRELMGDLNENERDSGEGEQSTIEELEDDDDDDALEDEEVTLDTIENAMAQLEDEDDIVAMRGARDEFLTEQREFDEEGTSVLGPASHVDKRRVSGAGTEASRASSPGLDGATGDDDRNQDNQDTEDRQSVEMVKESPAASIFGDGELEAKRTDDIDISVETDEIQSVEDDTSMVDDGEGDEDAPVERDDSDDGSEISDSDDDSDDDMSDDELKPRRRKTPGAKSGQKRSRGRSGLNEGASKRQKTTADTALATAAQEKKRLERAKEKAREMEEERKLQAWKDSVSSLQNFEDSLNAVDRYALHFREDVDPLYAYVPTAEAYGRLDDEAKLLNIEEIEAQKMIEEQQWIADGELITGVTSIDELSASEIEMHYQLYKKERSNVYASRRHRQLTGEAWELKKCAITGQPFYYNTDTREATWDKPTVWVKNEQCATARELGFSGLPTNVLLQIFGKLQSYPDRLNGVQFVCRSWRDAALHPSLSVRVNASDFFNHHSDSSQRNHWAELLGSVQKGDTLLFGSGVYEIHEAVEITKPIRLLAAHDAHVELQMATPQAQLKWTAPGGLICGFHISRRHSSTLSGGDPTSNWQHLLHVTQRGCVRAVFNDFDGNHQGNACLAVSGDPRSLLVLQHNRIFHSGSGSGIIVLQGALVMQRNSVFQNAHSGITVLSGNAVVRRNQIFSNKRFGIRLLYHANNVVIEENKVENHPCGNIDVENSGRRFVVRWNEMLKDEVDDLPHNHGQVRLLTSRVEERVVKIDKPIKPVKRRPKQLTPTVKPSVATYVKPLSGTAVKPLAAAAVSALPGSMGVAVLSKALAVAFAPPLDEADTVKDLSSTPVLSAAPKALSGSVSEEASTTKQTPSVTNAPMPDNSSTQASSTGVASTSTTTTSTIMLPVAPMVSAQPVVVAPAPALLAAKAESLVTVSTESTSTVKKEADPSTASAQEAPILDKKPVVSAIEPSLETPKPELSVVIPAVALTSEVNGVASARLVSGPVKVRRKRKPKTERVLVHGVELVFKDTCEKKGEKKVKKPRRASGEGVGATKIKLEALSSTPTPTAATTILTPPATEQQAPPAESTPLHSTRPHLGEAPPVAEKDAVETRTTE